MGELIPPCIKKREKKAHREREGEKKLKKRWRKKARKRTLISFSQKQMNFLKVGKLFF